MAFKRPPPPLPPPFFHKITCKSIPRCALETHGKDENGGNMPQGKICVWTTFAIDERDKIPYFPSVHTVF